MRILIIEDDTSLVRGLKKALATAGFAVDHEINGAEAIEIAPSEAYSLIVLDLGLPGLPGQEVLRRLRNNGCEVPILILTALGEVKDKVKCLNLGADDYLTKPFDLDEFEARVKALVRRGKGRPDPILRCGSLMLETSSATATIEQKTVVAASARSRRPRNSDVACWPPRAQGAADFGGLWLRRAGRAKCDRALYRAAAAKARTGRTHDQDGAWPRLSDGG